MKTIRFIGVLLLAILSAFAAAFSNGHAIAPLAAWIAPALLLRVTRSQPVIIGFVIALAVMTPSWLFQWTDVFRLHGVMTYLTAVEMTALGLAPYIADRLIAPRLGPFLGSLVFPCALVALEWGFTQFSPLGSWGSIAYTQTDFSWLAQGAAFGGMWLVSFVVAWFAAALNGAYEQRHTWRRAIAPVAAFAGVFVLVIALGGWRLSQPRAGTAEEVAVALPHYGANANYNLNNSAAIRAFMFAQTDALAHNGAKLIAWPEAALSIVSADEDGFLNQARELAQRDHAAIAVSYLMRFTPQSLRYENKSVLIGPSGAIDWRNSKTYPAPGAEERNMKPGNGDIATATLPLGVVQGATNFDLDHRVIARQIGEGTALLLSPGEDWPAIIDLHARMMRMRAIEYGVPILRPVLNGESAAYDAFGRIVPAAQTLRLTMPVGAAPTLYPRLGDAFAWLCAAAFGLLGLFSVAPKRRLMITPQPVAAE